VKHRDNRPGILPPILKFIQMVSAAAFAMCSAFHQTLHHETLLHIGAVLFQNLRDKFRATTSRDDCFVPR
jgi:hypothetical protein